MFGNLIRLSVICIVLLRTRNNPLDYTRLAQINHTDMAFGLITRHESIDKLECRHLEIMEVYLNKFSE